MGRQSRAVNSSSKGGVGVQSGDAVLNPEAMNTLRIPNDHLETRPKVPLLPGTNSTSSEASLPTPAGSNDGGTNVTEEEEDYDMCMDCMDAQDDDYDFVLVAVEPNAMPQKAVSRGFDKGQDISET